MKPPWQMNPTELANHHATQVAENLAMLDTANAPATEQAQRHRGIIAGRSAEGDEARLRGIPAIGRNVAGAIPGTSPHSIRS